MGGIFLATGRGVAKGARLPPVHAIDVAPTIARLTGISYPSSSTGRVLGEAFARAMEVK